MTAIKHHLTDDLIQGYSAGTLPEAVNLIIAAHVSLCDTCRAAVEAYDSLGGAVLDSADTAELREDSLANVMALISSAEAQPEPKPVQKADSVLPSPLLDYVGKGLDDVKWRPIGMGVKQAILNTSPEATARLLYIPAGVAVPDHGHTGLELTLVLKGAFEDEDGYFARGDIEVADQEVEHTPVADISEDCICLAVTDAPLKFKGLLPRIAQPFLNI